jgi:hypothetical protein
MMTELKQFLAVLVLVPAFDLGIKSFFRKPRNSLSERPGAVCAVHGRLWWRRLRNGLEPRIIWFVWSLCALPILAAAWMVPSAGTYAGLLLGGSLSHAIESTACDGRILDYLRLPSGMAFDLSDVAIWSGVLGVLASLPLIPL